MITLYSMPSSGNSYKVRLLLAQLDIPFNHIATEYDQGREITKTEEFQKHKNPTGKVPTIEFEDGECLSESNAILHFFGEDTAFVPSDKLTRARMYQRMFFEQNFHEGSVATRAANLTYPEREHLRTPEILGPLLEAGNRTLDIMEVQLNKTPYLAGNDYTLADVCLYAYTHSAAKGGFDVVGRTGIATWLKRVSDQPGHVTLDWLP